MPSVGATRFWMYARPAVEPLRLRRLPMFAAAACFALGDMAARHWHGPALLCTDAVLLLLLTALSQRYAPRIALLPAFSCWIAIGCWCAQLQPPIPAQHALAENADGLSRIVRGRIVRIRSLEKLTDNADTPQQEYEPGAWETSEATATQSVDLDVQAMEYLTPDISRMDPASGGIRITVLDNALALRCGDVLEMPLRLRLPEVYRDPGAWSYRDQLLTEGIGALATVKAGRIQVTGAGASTWRCRIYTVQSWAAARLDAFITSRANRTLPHALRLTAQDAAMLNAMLFGDRTALTHTLRTGFERTGTFHLFVVSGLHVAFFTAAMAWLLRRARLPEGVVVTLTIAATTAYAMLTGFGVPAQRALLMAAVYLIARWLSREITVLNALGAAALIVLVLDPRALFEASFQMTFLVIVAVAGLATPLIARFIHPWSRALRHLSVIRIDAGLHPRHAQFRVRLRMACRLCGILLHPRLQSLPLWLLRAIAYVGELVLVSITIEACMILPMAVYFHRITLYGIPTNIFAIPLVGLTLGIAVFTFCLLLLSPWLAMVPTALTAALLHFIHALVDRSQHAAFADIRIPAPSATNVFVLLLALVFACLVLRQKSRYWVIAGIVATVLIPGVAVWPGHPLLHAGTLEVTALDVGQGDSLLVVGPTGETMLVDAGGPVGRAADPDKWDVGEEVVAPYLWSRRIRRLDAVVLTHAHSDHMGGMPAVLRDFRPRELWLSVEPGRSPGLHALLEEARSLGVTVRWLRAGDALAWGGLHADVLAPEASYANAGTAVNNDSLVLRLAYGKGSVLLEGDAEAPSEATMLAYQRVTASTLLKIGHHGSRTSTTPSFLAAVAPQDAVISVGAHNTFGHPREEVLERLEASHVKTFRTDRFGAETFLLGSDGSVMARSAGTE